MTGPRLADIHAAELRFVAARNRTADGGRRAWLAMNSALAHPSSLALVAAAGFCGGLLASRSGARRASPDKEQPAGEKPLAGLILVFFLRYAMRLLPMIVGRMWAEQRTDEPCTVVKTTVVRDRPGT